MTLFVINGKFVLLGGRGGGRNEDAYLIFCCLYSIFLTVRVGYPLEQHALGGRELLHKKLIVKVY
jgi:hypothetical protein